MPSALPRSFALAPRVEGAPRVSLASVTALCVFVFGAAMLGACKPEPLDVVSCTTTADCPSDFLCAADICVPDLLGDFDVDLDVDFDVDFDVNVDVDPDDVNGGDGAGDDTVSPDTGSDCTDRCTQSRDCGAGLTCEAGCCVVPETLTPCQAHEAACSSVNQTTAGFFCDTANGVCLQRCEFGGRAVSADCPSRSYCGAELTGIGANDLDGFCLPSECTPLAALGCDSDETCRPFANGASFCLPSGAAAPGASCGGSDDLADLCLEGSVCVQGACVRLCEGECSGNEECLPVFGDTFGEFGGCGEPCAPYPRMGFSGGYGCDEQSDSCLPFAPSSAAGASPGGFCRADPGTIVSGPGCAQTGQLGGDCNDLGACLDGEGCGPLCEPFSRGQCDNFPTRFCSGLESLFSAGDFSYCSENTTPGTIGQACAAEDAGIPCADDSSLCWDVDAGPQCYAVCRVGVPSDCPEGLSCDGNAIAGAAFPSPRGLCL